MAVTLTVWEIITVRLVPFDPIEQNYGENHTALNCCNKYIYERYDTLVDISIKYFQQNLTVSHKERKRDGGVRNLTIFPRLFVMTLFLKYKKNIIVCFSYMGRHIWCNLVNRRLRFLVNRRHYYNITEN